MQRRVVLRPQPRGGLFRHLWKRRPVLRMMRLPSSRKREAERREIWMRTRTRTQSGPGGAAPLRLSRVGSSSTPPHSSSEHFVGGYGRAVCTPTGTPPPPLLRHMQSRLPPLQEHVGLSTWAQRTRRWLRVPLPRLLTFSKSSRSLVRHRSSTTAEEGPILRWVGKLTKMQD